MFIITITYTQPLSIIDTLLPAHRNFLESGYQKNYFLASGPKNPRTGGIVISQLKDRQQLEEIFKQDPYYLNHAADYEIVEFNPVKYHQDFKCFVDGA